MIGEGKVALLTAEELQELLRAAVREVMQERAGDEGYMDTAQAAHYLGTTVKALQAAVYRKRIVPDHRGSRGGLRGNRFSRATLDEFCKRHGKPV